MPDDQILDLDALEVEATDAPFNFKFDRKTYTMPPRMDVRAIALLDAGKLDQAFAVLLGPEQWQQLLDSPKTFDDTHFSVLLDGYFKHLGVGGLGELLGSTASSGRTVEPSKRTSRASTAKGSPTSRPGR